MAPPDSPRRLGRGLDALLAGRTTRDRSNDADPKSAAATARPRAPDTATADTPPAPAGPDGDLRRIPLARIRANPFQPRQVFHDDELDELAASIKANGLLQPVSVRPVGDGYELIAGERRFRAVTSLGWTDVPAVVRPLDDEQALALALVENLQRSDLDPLEEAEGYQRLMAEFGATQSMVAEAVGKDRSTVANALRLLGLPASVRRLVQERRLSAGHARALLGLADERSIADLARAAADGGWSVRETERRVKAARGPAAAKKNPTRPAPDDRATRHVDDQLRRRFQTQAKVTLSGRDRGEVRIAFTSNDDLARILALMGVSLD